MSKKFIKKRSNSAFRKFSKHTKDQLREVDYANKLTDEELRYVKQFYLEYYQGDFNWEQTIHPEYFKKDCMDRHRQQRRQITSVGPSILGESARKARVMQNQRVRGRTYYIPEDYYPIRGPYTEDDDDK